MRRGWKGFILFLSLPSSRTPRLAPLLFSLLALSACSRRVHVIWWERRDKGLEGGERERNGCSFPFLSHSVWHAMPLLISTVGSHRFECWEFKRRLPGHWHFRLCVYMFWNVKCTLKNCVQLSLSSLRFNAIGVYYVFKQGPPLVCYSGFAQWHHVLLRSRIPFTTLLRRSDLTVRMDMMVQYDDTAPYSICNVHTSSGLTIKVTRRGACVCESHLSLLPPI